MSKKENGLSKLLRSQIELREKREIEVQVGYSQIERRKIPLYFRSDLEKWLDSQKETIKNPSSIIENLTGGFGLSLKEGVEKMRFCAEPKNQPSVFLARLKDSQDAFLRGPFSPFRDTLTYKGYVNPEEKQMLAKSDSEFCMFAALSTFLQAGDLKDGETVRGRAIDSLVELFDSTGLKQFASREIVKSALDEFELGITVREYLPLLEQVIGKTPKVK